MTLASEVQKIYGKFIWILDDFRINFNHIENLYKDFIKTTTINAVNMVKRSIEPTPKKKFFRKKSNQIKPNIIKQYNRSEEIKDISHDPGYSYLENVLYIDKMEYSKNNMKDFIENAYLYGTQSDFLYRSAFIYVITLYEGFNDKIFSLLEKFKPEWFINKKGKKINYNSNIDTLTENFKDRYGLFNLESEFELFRELKYYYYLRHTIVHNLGIIDEKFTDKIDNHKKDIGKKVQVSKHDFNQLTDILLVYFMFIRKTLLDMKDLIIN